MSLQRLVVAIALLLACQAAAQDRMTSPDVHPDRTVTFRLEAPQASQVVLSGFGAARAMAKDDHGIWSITIGPLAPEIYSYTFRLDGATVLDPLNRDVKKWIRCESLVTVPGDPPEIWERRPVPHGTVHQETYTSKSVHGPRDLFVYTPPGYADHPTQKYPVLFLMHGYGDDASAWTAIGRVHWIADNLLAEGAMRPMIIVMPNGHPLPLDGRRFDDYAATNSDLLERDYFEDMVPFIRSRYRARTGAVNQAIAGLSMGGGQSLTIGLKHLNSFGWIAGFSSAAPAGALDQDFASLIKNPDRINRSIRLLWIGCGKDDSLLPRNERFVQWLTEHGIDHTWRATDGAHSWTIWRGYIAELLPQLFKS